MAERFFDEARGTQLVPEVVACPETLPAGPVAVPEDHPIVRQTVEDCLTEPMDASGFLEVLHGLRNGTLEARGEIRGGRFVAGFDGEQHALPGAVTVRRESEVAAPPAMAHVTAGDPLDYDGILTPDERGHAAEVRGQSVDVRRRPTW